MSDNLWETHAEWWIDGFTEGADPEYVEQILPLAAREIQGARRVLDVGCGDGQVSRLAASLGAEVLAIDPTSRRSGGSILGDKTRMEMLSRREEAFIRPTPAGQTLGGVARHTRETIQVVEAAGFDVVLVARREHLVRITVTMGSEPPKNWRLEIDPNAGDAARQALDAWLRPSA